MKRVGKRQRRAQNKTIRTTISKTGLTPETSLAILRARPASLPAPSPSMVSTKVAEIILELSEDVVMIDLMLGSVIAEGNFEEEVGVLEGIGNGNTCKAPEADIANRDKDVDTLVDVVDGNDDGNDE